MNSKTPSFTNRLSKETSPYLLQHAHNPVDWYPWGTEALERAKKENKAIFLSIGYSACHWCHVMERESFEDAETAKIMNDHFVNIKVDREERQDLDSIYMGAVQLMTQHGGWPMSVFLTPDLEPFYGGTYFPPVDKMGMPSFKRILMGVAQAWRTRKEEVTKSAKELIGALREMAESNTEAGAAVSLDLVDQAVQAIGRAYDPEHGGIGSAPKFFHTMDLRVCLRHWQRTQNPQSLSLVTHTLEQWARGGIYDALGGGFHRYSTDREWLVPHFEKMLYDNALVTQVYLEAYQATKQPDLARVARETLDYILREMTSPDGGFFSTQDADSEGVEGKFYVWSQDEIKSLLDEDRANLVSQVYQVRAEGNWEGHNILHRRKSWAETAKDLGMDEQTLEDSIASAKRKLLAARQQRVIPFKDTKIIAAWNGLMIETLAYASQVLGEQRYLEAAKKSAGFLMEHLWSGKARSLRHSFKDGRAQFNAYLDDYASVIQSLITLYEASFENYWLDSAEELTKVMLEQFWDEKTASFYYTAKDHEKLVLRPRDSHDGATPSGSGLAAAALIRLGRLLDESSFLKKAEALLKGQEKNLRMIPMASGQMLVALELLIDRPKECVFVAGDSKEEFDAMVAALNESYLPNKVMALWTKKRAAQPLFRDRVAKEGKTTLYLCENFACRTPITSPEQITAALRE